MNLAPSLAELGARARAHALLDQGSGRELVGPLAGLMSPHLLAQQVVPQSDDGVVVVRGFLAGRPTLVMAIEGRFQGGGLGEVGGAKILAALSQVLASNQAGQALYPVLLLDTGGVRLQEANYGLLVVSEIQDLLIALRALVPVIGVVPGPIGCFGGLAITAALATYLIGTPLARMGLNGPEVIEQEAGVREFDAADRALIWHSLGLTQRVATGLVDELVNDDVGQIKQAIAAAMAVPVGERPLRSRRYDEYLAGLAALDLSQRFTPEGYREAYQQHQTRPRLDPVVLPLAQSQPETRGDQGRGQRWFGLLTKMLNPYAPGDVGSVLVTDAPVANTELLGRYIAVVANANSRFARARAGEVGLQEGYALAHYVHAAIVADSDQAHKRPIILVVDVPSQAFGYHEELMGLHLSLAASVDACATARRQGHAVIAVLVGQAISGAFLALGLQSNRILALRGEGVQVQAMSLASAARVTQRSVAAVKMASAKVPAMAYDVDSFSQLGGVYHLIEGVAADSPSVEDVAVVETAIVAALVSLQDLPPDFAVRHEGKGRAATRAVRQQLLAEWT
ncbi:MAG: biotin-independent malonate decarboxylase subunit beta [Neisseriaceae bacterium]|nr:biotin-independent malonate decarboxylase subunit beta [Neisseriaceae bacterium]